MKIAILYICTGKYNQFFRGFYQSSEQLFVRNIEKDYFVFTDNLRLCDATNVFLIQKESRGFPLDSLFRFDMFLSVKDRLLSYDYVFFFNSNMLFVDSVGDEILPKNEDLVAVVHPGYYNKCSFLFPYERNKKSTAYIRYAKKAYRYYMGSLNGGKTMAYLKLIEECAKNVNLDFDQKIIAMVHDESHLNKYLSEHSCLGISPSYAYPEGWKLPFKSKIIIRDKVKVDSYFNKGRDHSFIGKLIKLFQIIYRSIIWYL